MKADQDKVREAIKANPPKGEVGYKTRKQLGEPFGLSGPRISQIASGLKD